MCSVSLAELDRDCGGDYTNATIEWNIKDNEQRVKLAKQMTVDMDPRLLYCKSTFIDLLLQSRCYRYIDLSLLHAIQMQTSDGRLARVPLSKEDVFMDKSIALAEKRIFMKFTSSLLATANTDDQNDNDESMDELLARNQITSTKQPLLYNFLKYAIVNCTSSEENVSAKRANSRFRQFMESVGKYGDKSPFLVVNYGTSELCQAFCR